LELPSISWRRIGLPLLLTTLALGLHGCVPKHEVGNWRKHNDYLLSMEYIPPGGNQHQAALNTCLKPPGEVLQCSGHGWCERRSNRPNAIAFCKCERDWADPECRTRRKSQTTAFILSLFLGFFGADLYYLGYPATAFCKLLTSCSFQMAAVSVDSSGGILTSCACFWWLFDIVRTGSGAVYAANYRVAADLPHSVFMMTIVFVFFMGGVVMGVESYAAQRNKKRANQMSLHDKEEAFASKQRDGLKFRVQRPGGEPCNFEQRGFGGYGAMLLQKPMYESNSGQSYAEDAFYCGQSTPGTLAPPEAPKQLAPVVLPAVVAEQGCVDPTLWEDEEVRQSSSI
jgi:TM2 domain-containing membrane protein YozV